MSRAQPPYASASGSLAACEKASSAYAHKFKFASAIPARVGSVGLASAGSSTATSAG